MNALDPKTLEAAYGPIPDDEISPETWMYVHTQFVRPTTDRSFYTFVALLVERHNAVLRAATTGRETREALTTRPVVYISAYDVSMMVSDAMEDTVRAALEALPEPELGEKVLPLYLHPSAADTAHVRDALRVADMAFTDIAQFRPDGTGDNFQQIASHARATALEAMPIVRRALASNGDGDE